MPEIDIPPSPENNSFAWNSDEYWSLLENRFREAHSIGCTGLSSEIESDFKTLDSLLVYLKSDTLAPESNIFTGIEKSFFELGVYLAACPESLIKYIESFNKLRTLVKNQSINWDVNSQMARSRIYRLLYGGRTAIEEVMQQSPTGAIPEAVLGTNESSATPAAEILGVRIHSGDILVSRGGAPTSALIARGNDYPGNFSHAALVHIDEKGNEVSIIESHIEIGVAVASIDDYMRDTKLRVMVLRLRSDLPFMQADPMLPHRAAEFALHRALTEQIPYDFAMDTKDHDKLFCSEVVSAAYEQVGVGLWTALSNISGTGVKSWLAAFGVKYFVTQEPSDLEYDPQLRVVAEWRDHETLHKDRLDNGVVDVMLEEAESGRRLTYDWYKLPMARILKLYSFILNRFGGVGPVPEGMSATAALKNEWFSTRHENIKAELIVLEREFKENNGYSPPYWELIKLARKAAEI